MKAYLVTTGVVFGLVVIVHLWRIVSEWPHLATSPLYLALTVAAAGLCIWAWRLLRLLPRS